MEAFHTAFLRVCPGYFEGLERTLTDPNPTHPDFIGSSGNFYFDQYFICNALSSFSTAINGRALYLKEGFFGATYNEMTVSTLTLYYIYLVVYS